MKSFSANLLPDFWLEIAQGREFVAFDLVESGSCEVFFSESDAQPSQSQKGNFVQSWHNGWDFSMSGLDAGKDRVWVRGTAIIRGVR